MKNIDLGFGKQPRRARTRGGPPCGNFRTVVRRRINYFRELFIFRMNHCCKLILLMLLGCLDWMRLQAVIHF